MRWRLIVQALDEDGVARVLGVTVAALRRWRRMGVGPRFRKIGRSVRYVDEDVRDFLERCASGGGVPPNQFTVRAPHFRGR